MWNDEQLLREFQRTKYVGPLKLILTGGQSGVEMLRLEGNRTKPALLSVGKNSLLLLLFLLLHRLCLVSLKSKRWCHWRCSHFLSLSFFLRANSCDLWWRSISSAISLPRLFCGVTARKPFGCPCQRETHQPQHINSYKPGLGGGGWGAL